MSSAPQNFVSGVISEAFDDAQRLRSAPGQLGDDAVQRDFLGKVPFADSASVLSIRIKDPHPEFMHCLLRRLYCC